MPRAKSDPTPTLVDPRWAQVVARDPQAEGAFVYAVHTTGVFCRSSCSARLPRPEHVSFFTSCDEAEAAGFRACLRCLPRELPLAQRQAALVAKACRFIEAAEEAPSLKEVAAEVGLSPHHFQRIFKQHTGLSPKGYASAHRATRLREALTRATTVTEAIFEAGFASNGPVYKKQALLGMSPSSYRAGGARSRIRFAVGQASLGAVLVAQSEVGLCAILLGDDAEALLRDLQDRFPQADLVGGDADYEGVVGQVLAFVDAPWLGLDLPLELRGTAFQQRVWQVLRGIPAGQRLSYAQVAEKLGEPKAVRAVAGACAANALAVAIPCHRVVRSDGSLSGYRWGVARKEALLAKEASA